VSAVDEDQPAALSAPPFEGVAANAEDARPKVALPAANATPLASIIFIRSRRDAPAADGGFDHRVVGFGPIGNLVAHVIPFSS
jgi:hypothetical protein